MLNVACFLKKEGKSCFMEEWIKTKWYIYIMEYYSARKKKEILPFVTTWMKSKDIMVSEIYQTQKDKYYMISLKCRIQKS